MKIETITDRFTENSLMLDITGCPYKMTRVLRQSLEGWAEPLTLIYCLNNGRTQIYFRKKEHFSFDGFIEAVRTTEKSINEVMEEENAR